MKHTYYFLASLLLLTASAAAQDFRPFRPGLTYQLSEAATLGDTTHTLRLDLGSRVGTDSVFRFNPMVRRTARNSNSCGGIYQKRPDNLFGATLTVKPSGQEYVLTAANGRRCTLRPRQAVQQPWLAIAPNVTAQVTVKAAAQVFGQADSVVTISFSNGASMRLSKRFGLLEGPTLLAYLDGRYRLRQLTTAVLPSRHSAFRAQAILDFQPGDVFLRYTRGLTADGYLCTEGWQRDSIISRVTSRTGDTIDYTLQTRTLTRAYGTAGAPTGYCNTPQGTALGPSQTITQRITSATADAIHNIATNEFRDYQFPSFSGYSPVILSSTPFRNPARFNGRLERRFMTRAICGTNTTADSLWVREGVDFFMQQRFAVGLGLTHRYSWNAFSGDDITELIGYRKGTETWGQLRTFAQLLPTTSARPAASTAAYPNPFSQELRVSFELARPQAVALELRDALGRVVLTKPAAALAAGTSQLNLSTAAVPPGIYSLVLKEASGAVQVLKVTKIQ